MRGAKVFALAAALALFINPLVASAANIADYGTYYSTSGEQWFFVVGFEYYFEILILFPLDDLSQAIVLTNNKQIVDAGDGVVTPTRMKPYIDGVLIDLSAIGWGVDNNNYYWHDPPAYVTFSLAGSTWTDSHYITLDTYDPYQNYGYTLGVSDVSIALTSHEMNASVHIEVVTGDADYSWFVWLGVLVLNNQEEYEIVESRTNINYYGTGGIIEPGTFYYTETSGILGVSAESYQLWGWYTRGDYTDSGVADFWVYINTTGTLYEPPSPPPPATPSLSTAQVLFWAIVAVLIVSLLGMVVGGVAGGLAGGAVAGFVLAEYGFVPVWLPLLFAIALILLVWLRVRGGAETVGGEAG